MNRDAKDAFESLSSGPNGPAVATSHLDARAVIDEPILYKSIRDLNIALEQR
jgi:hypothetical protein